ncbi:MAG TPA: hypothetical protein VIY48_16525 [Candidatus Paceibacterota bacterium]
MDLVTFVAVATFLASLIGAVWYVRNYIDATARDAREETLRRVGEIYAKALDLAVLSARLEAMSTTLSEIKLLVTELHKMTQKAEPHHASTR